MSCAEFKSWCADSGTASKEAVARVGLAVTRAGSDQDYYRCRQAIRVSQGAE